MSIPTEKLTSAAMMVHEALKAKKLRHYFLGGYEFILLGAQRITKDVDVEVIPSKMSTLPLIGKNPVQRVMDAFTDETKFRIVPGTNATGVRLFCNVGTTTAEDFVGIDILMRDSTRHPKEKTKKFPSVPGLKFYSVNDLFIDKLITGSVRGKDRDCEDVAFLHNHCASQIDKAKVQKRVSAAVAQAFFDNYQDQFPAVQAILGVYGFTVTFTPTAAAST